MTNIDFIGYLTICLLAAGTPGPGTLAVINQSLIGGVKTTLPLILGIGLGLASASMLTIMSLLYSYAIAPWTFNAIGVCGASYLGYLGIKLIVSTNKQTQPLFSEDSGIDVIPLILQGVSISLLNPKTMLFFLAIYPVYIQSASSLSSNFMTLTFTLVLVTASVHILYSILSAKIAQFLTINTQLITRSTGIIFIGFAMLIVYETFSLVIP